MGSLWVLVEVNGSFHRTWLWELGWWKLVEASTSANPGMAAENVHHGAVLVYIGR